MSAKAFNAELHRATIETMLAGKAGIKPIARAIGVSFSTAKKAITRLGLSLPEQVDVWTPEIVAELESLWNAGHSAGACTAKLNAKFADFLSKSGPLTRNAVLGKAHRLLLAVRPSPLKPATENSRRQREKRDAVIKEKLKPPPAPGEGCRFPMWGYDEAPTHVYCGADQEFRMKDGELVRSSYCPPHAKRCYRGIPDLKPKRAA